MKFYLSLIFFVSAFNSSYSQGSHEWSPENDEYVKQLGPLAGFNVATIADTITRKFSEKKDKARAVFFWVSNNIALDPKAMRSNDNKNTDPVMVIETRKTTALGFATLVQEMCSMANIRCLVVDGYIKNLPEDINNKPDEINHSWNVVQLGQSPEEWFYIDAAKASGFINLKSKSFTKQFTSEYFFPEKVLFNMDHYPDNSAWILGGGGKNSKDFYLMPVVCNAAYIYGLRKFSPLNGHIKTKTKNTTAFSFSIDKPVTSVSFVYGQGNKQSKPEPVNFTDNGGNISFNYQFKKDDSFPLTIMVDEKEFLQYYVEVSE